MFLNSPVVSAHVIRDRKSYWVGGLSNQVPERRDAKI